MEKGLKRQIWLWRGDENTFKKGSVGIGSSAKGKGVSDLRIFKTYEDLRDAYNQNWDHTDVSVPYAYWHFLHKVQIGDILVVFKPKLVEKKYHHLLYGWGYVTSNVYEVPNEDNNLHRNIEWHLPFLTEPVEDVMMHNTIFFHSPKTQEETENIERLLMITEYNSDMETKVDVYIKLLEANHNLILTGAPGTGKTYIAKKMAAKMLGTENADDIESNEQYGFVQFHPSYDYTDFVEGLRPKSAGDGFELRAGVFKEFCAKAIKEENDSRKKYVFVIDEINRGEISKILGELFFSIDPGYRGKEGKVKTQYQNMIDDGDVFKDGFYVPKNVYIIGTMNDIDRSVESMDFAMRRRFAWKEVTAEDSEAMLYNNDKLKAEIVPEIMIRMRNLNFDMKK